MKNKDNNESIEHKSSLFNYNFSKFTKDQIIEKYEIILASREKQLQDLSMMIGTYNEKLTDLSDLVISLKEEKEELTEKVSKFKDILNQELQNKEIMFIRLQTLENEHDKLLKNSHNKFTKPNRENITSNETYDSYPNNFSLFSTITEEKSLNNNTSMILLDKGSSNEANDIKEAGKSTLDKLKALKKKNTGSFLNKKENDEINKNN